MSMRVGEEQEEGRVRGGGDVAVQTHVTHRAFVSKLYDFQELAEVQCLPRL
jgi:hypothetical protein